MECQCGDVGMTLSVNLPGVLCQLFADVFILFYFILILIWLLSHAELLDTGFVDSENLSRNKN